MTITVIGAFGKVGSAVSEFFENLGHTVLRVDLNTTLTLEEAASKADIVFVAVLPMEQTASLLLSAALVMKSGSLLIHGTSIEQPVMPFGIDVKTITKRVVLCHWHLHFRPQRPLSRTLFGQHLSMSFRGRGSGRWRAWLEDSLEPFHPIIKRFLPGHHDQVTSVSQVLPMLTSFLVIDAMHSFSREIAHQGNKIAGPPAKFLHRSLARNATGAEVIAGIVVNHPAASKVLDAIERAIPKVRSLLARRNVGGLVKNLQRAGRFFNLQDLNASTNQLIRLEADMREAHFSFRFTAGQNRLGLLAAILSEFDHRGVDKTTTIAQTDPDGGCTIIIGVREHNDAAKEAANIIESWTRQ